jgi:hypothetical protein
VLDLSLAALLLASWGQAVPVRLASIDEAVVGGFEASEVESRLRSRLARQKGLRLVEDPTADGLRLRVTACYRVEKSKSTVEVRRDPVTVLTPRSGGGFGEGHGNDTMYGVSADSKDWVLLRLQVSWQDETLEIASGERDLSLEAAASTVVKQLEKLAKMKARPQGR